MAKALGIAVVGCGRIGDSHMDGVRLNPDLARLVAVADVDFDRAAGAAKRYGARPYATLDQALMDAEVDAVVLCTPNEQHCPGAIAAARSGRHVLVEKPMATTPRDGLAMVEACERAGVTLMAGQSRRYIPAVNLAWRRRAEIGRTLHVVYTLTRYYDRASAPPWWRSIKSSGGLVITQLGAHAIDYGLWYMDGKSPVSVFAQGADFNEGLEGPDECTVVVRFDDGSLLTTVLSINARQQRHECYIIGEKGTMLFTHGGTDVYVGVRSPSTELFVNGDKVMSGQSMPHNFALQIAEFASAIAKGRAPLSAGRSVLTQLKVLEAAKVSALRGAPVALAGFDEVAYG